MPLVLPLIDEIFLAVNIPDCVINSITSLSTKPDEKATCAAANVAWPQRLSSTIGLNHLR
uniref:Uncharacterized protein n=1 Tax=Medicago truncatula TaxID=3880 RepID=I3T7F7_MEDTR|nr:unknown [Medicago truncatula]